MNDLQVAGTYIRRDKEGRYCLNDLHRAAGGEQRHRPNRWLRYEQAKALIAEIERQNSEACLGLRNGENKTEIGLIPGREFPPKSVVTIAVGRPETYAVKELVYAYAMWISAAFNLVVIRAFDALVNGEFAQLTQPNIQNENYWFERRPHWPPIKAAVLVGECYSAIAAGLGISRSRVARAVRSMIRVGILAPLKVAEMQRGPAKKAALRYGQGWGIRQLALFDEHSPAPLT